MYEYDNQGTLGFGGVAQGLFAIRSDGHSPIASAASIKGGVVIDLGCF